MCIPESSGVNASELEPIHEVSRSLGSGVIGGGLGGEE